MHVKLKSKGLMNKFFSLPIWVPLSRVTFATYLIHTLLIYSFYSSQENPIHIQDFTIVILFGYFFFGHLI